MTSCDHVTLKGQTRDPNTLSPNISKIAGDAVRQYGRLS